MKEISFDLKHNIKRSVSRIKEILKTEVLKDPFNPLFKSAITEVIILLRDLTWKSKNLGEEIDFNDFIDIDENLKIYNVSDLIRVFRDCFCHVETNKKNVGLIISDYNLVIKDDDISINMYL